MPDSKALARAFAPVPLAYVADGHHRSASAWRAGRELRAGNLAHRGDEEYNWFLAVLFPSDQLRILPYNRVVRDLNEGGALARYPGSPLIARRLMRDGDRLVVNELHPEDNAVLARLFARDRQTKVLALDGFTALKSLLPPMLTRLLTQRSVIAAA